MTILKAYSKLDDGLLKNPRIFVLNHFKNLRGIASKTGLIKSLREYYDSNDEASMKFFIKF